MCPYQVLDGYRQNQEDTQNKGVAPAAPPDARFPLVHSTEEDLLVLICEGEAEKLRGEAYDDIIQVTMPEGQDSLLPGDMNHAVDNALALLVCGDCLLACCTCSSSLTTPRVLHSFGGGHGHSTHQGILGEDTVGSVILKGRGGCDFRTALGTSWDSGALFND